MRGEVNELREVAFKKWLTGHPPKAESSHFLLQFGIRCVFFWLLFWTSKKVTKDFFFQTPTVSPPQAICTQHIKKICGETAANCANRHLKNG
ncbi:MAG: hypothetical protein ACRCYO_12645 [Bacteroidia bacterium]